MEAILMACNPELVFWFFKHHKHNPEPIRTDVRAKSYILECDCGMVYKPIRGWNVLYAIVVYREERALDKVRDLEARVERWRKGR